MSLELSMPSGEGIADLSGLYRWLLGKDITAEQGLSAMMPNSA